MKANKFQKMMSVASTIVPAAERHEKPDLTLPPTTGMGLTTQRVKLEQKLTALSAENEALRRQLEQVNQSTAAAQELLLDKIEANPWQPRRKLDVVDLTENVKLVGVLQPIVVRPHPEKPGYFQLLAGERRTLASKGAGLTTIPARVMTVDDASMAILALTENIDREDLFDYEIGRALASIKELFPNRKDMAEAVGLNRAELLRYMAFSQLPAFIRADLDEEPGLIGGTFAKDLVGFLEEASSPSLNEKLKECWVALKTGLLKQNKFIVQLTKMLGGAPAPKQRPAVAASSAPLMLGGKKAGSIKKDSKSLVVSIKASVISESQEQQIRALLAKLFK